MLSDNDARLSQVIFRLLRNATSQQIVKDFLKSKSVPTSAQNWDDLFTRRIQPALNDEIVTVAELRGLLRQVEECGRQHTFVYHCPPDTAAKLISPRRIGTIAGEQGLDGLFENPLDLELPDQPTIVDIRGARNDNGQLSLIIKAVETRTTTVLLGETMHADAGRMTKEYAVNKKRAVNIAELREDGLLQLRIASQDNQTRYHDNVQALVRKISPFIPMGDFAAISLSNAKAKLLRDRDELSNDIRYSNSTAKNAFGCVMNLATSSQENNLSTDDGSMAAIDSFLANEGRVTGTNVYVKIPGTEPQRELHVLLSGEVNEFAVPVACSIADYNYVCAKILALNQ